MKLLLSLLSVFLAVGCATDSADRILKDFPALRPADGSTGALKWTKYDGFEYLVFYGDLPADPSAGAGIYQGGEPQFKVPRNVQPEKGKLGIFDVLWYSLPDKDAKFYRTCLIDYQKTTVQREGRPVTYTTKRHVWAYADSQAGLDAVLAELNKLTMFATHPPDVLPELK